MITFRHKGDFSKTNKFFSRIKKTPKMAILEKYGKQGINALMEATPKDTGKTASSWYYEIEENQNGIRLVFSNSNIVNGWANIAILLQYGHGTGTGGWVEGIDYINPALKPIFEKIAEDAWKEVTSS